MQKIDWLLFSNFVLVKSNIGLLSVDSNRKSWKIGRTGPKIVDLVRFYLSLLYQLRNPLSKHFSWKLMYSYIPEKIQNKFQQFFASFQKCWNLIYNCEFFTQTCAILWNWKERYDVIEFIFQFFAKNLIKTRHS